MPTINPKKGAAAWRVEDPISRQGMEGTTSTSGGVSEVGSYRSELQGIHATLLGLLVFCTFYRIEGGTVTVGCDNLSCVRMARGDWRKVPLRTEHADLVRAIRILKGKLPITLMFVHVYGHQDDQLFFDDLDRLTQLNVKMDKKAKERLYEDLAKVPVPRCPSNIAFEGWQCIVLNHKATSDPSHVIRHAVFGVQLREHQVSRGLITREAFNDINWAAIKLASDHFPPLYRLWVAKHVSGFFGVGHMMEHWEFWDHSRCPCCDHEDETKVHFLTCPALSCSEHWAESLLGLRAWMDEVDTDPDIRDCIYNTLATRNPKQSFVTFSTARTLQAARAQDRIGWMFTTEGKMSYEWLSLQETHYSLYNPRRSARSWAAGLTTNLLHVTHSQWIHRNTVLHERDAQGLKIKEGQELSAAIEAQFSAGLDGLHPRDYHFINRGLDQINTLPAAAKKAWLRGISIAREIYLASEAREMESMRASMLNWLSTSKPST